MSMRFTDQLRSLSVRWKIRIAYWTGILLTAVIVIGLVGIFQHRTAVKNAYDKVYLYRSGKAHRIETWFAALSDKIRSLSGDPQTLEMESQLSEAFMNIESDNFATPQAESVSSIVPLLENYYSTEVLPVLESRDNQKTAIASILTSDPKQQIMQYLYIAGNSKSFDAKYTISKAADGSAYTELHARFHPQMTRLAHDAGISDVLLVDYKTGYVTYSLKKHLDFGTNLYEGPYQGSGLGQAFKTAIGLPAGSFYFTDESFYTPALLKPVIFLSAPVYSGSEIKGAVIFAIEVGLLNDLMTSDQDDLVALPGLKTFITGSDLRYRTDDPELASDHDRYIRKIKRNAENGNAYNRIKQLNTTALIQQVDPLAFADGLNGREKLAEYTTESGQTVLSAYGPVHIPGLKWLMVSQLDKSLALKPARRQLFLLIIISIFIAAIGYAIVHVLTRQLSLRLSTLAGNLKSTIGLHMDGNPGDEINQTETAVNHIHERVDEAARYVSLLGENNLEKEIEVYDESDTLGISLNNLRQILVDRREQEIKRTQEDEIRNWTTHGVAMFNDILRMDNNNLEKLSLNIIRNIIQYLSANQGGIFLVNKEEGDTYLQLIAAYAYDRQKFLNKKIGLGEGMAGTCALEKKTILLSRIPQDYLEITSGLGGARPTCLLIVPLKKDEEVLGVIEMASFNLFKPHEVEFVEKIGESIASALVTVTLHLQTSQYLERFQQQAEEMKAQDEELRQNIEEMQATHEQMERMKLEEEERNRQKELELTNSRKLLIDILDKIPAKIFLKDENGVFVVVNNEVSSVYNKTTEEIIGTSDYDNHPNEDVDSWRKQELEIMKKGETNYIHAEKTGNKVKYLNTIKMPFLIATTKKTGLLGIQFDVSEIKEKEEEAVKLAEVINEKQKELETSMAAVQKEKALLDALLNNVPEHIYFKDKESKFLRFSKSMIKLFGLEKEEDLVGKSDFDFFDDAHARPAYEGEQEIIRTGKAIIDLEEKEVMEDGRINWVNTTKMPLRNAQGEIIGTFGISKDITNMKKLEQDAIEKNEELKAQEEELRQNLEEMHATQDDMRRQIDENLKMHEALSSEKSLLDALLNNVPEHIYFKDKESRFLRFSKSMFKLFGLKKAEDLVGKSDFDFFDDAHARPAFEDEQNIIRTGKAIIDFEEKEVMADGRISWVNTTKMPLVDENGKIVGTFGISKNISHLKKLEEEAATKSKMVEELQTKYEALRSEIAILKNGHDRRSK